MTHSRTQPNTAEPVYKPLRSSPSSPDNHEAGGGLAKRTWKPRKPLVIGDAWNHHEPSKHCNMNEIRRNAIETHLNIVTYMKGIHEHLSQEARQETAFTCGAGFGTVWSSTSLGKLDARLQDVTMEVSPVHQSRSSAVPTTFMFKLLESRCTK